MYFIIFFVSLLNNCNVIDFKMDNPKYQQLIKTSKSLFWKYGIKRVTIEEICKVAGVSKMTFYKHFPNKIELARKVWHNEIENSMNRYRKVIDGDLDFQEKLKELVLIKLETTQDISTEFISDIYNNPALGLQSEIEKYSNESLSIFIKFLKESQKKGHFRKDIKIDFVLYYFNQISHLFDDKNLVSKYDHPHDLIMEALNFLFYGLSPER